MHHRLGLKIIFLATACAFPFHVAAQSPEPSGSWTGQAMIYGWLPVITGAQEGRDGEPALDLKADDILSRLDMAFMGTVELRRNKWGLIADALYIDLSHDADWLQERVNVSTNTTVKMLTLAAAYRWHEDDRSSSDVYVGARYIDTHLDFGVATDAGQRQTEASLSWTDGIVGLRGDLALNDRWSLRGFMDIGGFDSSSDLSWQAYGGANYSISEKWQATFGYRYLSIVKEAGSRAELDMEIHGPVIGVAYQF
jgi:opacity protein-like surface antigen